MGNYLTVVSQVSSGSVYCYGYLFGDIVINITIMMVHTSDGIILLRAVLNGLLRSEPGPQILEELFDGGAEIVLDVLVFLDGAVVADDGDGEVPVEFHLRLPHAVLEEAAAVVELVEDLDVAGHDVQAVHAIDLFLLLQALGDGAVLGELVDVVEDLLLLGRQQVLEDSVDVLAKLDGVVFLGVVEHSDQPVEVVVVEGLHADVLGHACHSQRVFVLELLPVLAGLVAVELLVELDGPADCLMEAQVVTAFLLCLLALVPQHS